MLKKNKKIQLRRVKIFLNKSYNNCYLGKKAYLWNRLCNLFYTQTIIQFYPRTTFYSYRMIKILRFTVLLILTAVLLGGAKSVYATKCNLENSSVIEYKFQTLPESKKKYNIDDIKLYPNPAGDYFRIENGVNIKDIEVINVLGKVVKQYAPASQSENFYIGDLNTGLYLVRMLDKNKNVIKTIRLQKK